MSEENVEIVLRAYRAYNDRDPEAIIALSHPNCVIYTAVEGRAEPQPFRGHSGIREWIANEDAVWASIRIDDLEVRDLEGERLLTKAVAFLRGKESGIEIRTELTTVFELREGKVVRMRAYLDRADALESAGPSE